MLSSASCGMAATGTTLSKVRPWPACGSMPFLAASAAASAMRFSSAARSSPRDARSGRCGTRPPARRGGSRPRSARVGLDEQADADAASPQPATNGARCCAARRRRARLRWSAPRASRGRCRRRAGGGERDLQHLLGRRHLQVERDRELGHQPAMSSSRDVAPVLAQVRGDAVRPGLAAAKAARTGSGCSPPRALRMVATWSMLTPRRSLPLTRRAAPGLLGGMAASSGGSASARRSARRAGSAGRRARRGRRAAVRAVDQRAAAITSPPARRPPSIASRDDRPVVTTSSTSSTFCPARGGSRGAARTCRSAARRTSPRGPARGPFRGR
jgi:hypothetical protein